MFCFSNIKRFGVGGFSNLSTLLPLPLAAADFVNTLLWGLLASNPFSPLYCSSLSSVNFAFCIIISLVPSRWKYYRHTGKVELLSGRGLAVLYFSRPVCWDSFLSPSRDAKYFLDFLPTQRAAVAALENSCGAAEAKVSMATRKHHRVGLMGEADGTFFASAIFFIAWIPTYGI